jgi:protein RecA
MATPERRKKLLETMKNFNKGQKEEILFLGDEIENQETVSTGITVIDKFLGGGIKRGTHTVIWGDFSTGKTSFCLQTIAQAQRDGLLCCYINLEKPVDNERFDMLGVNRAELIRADCTKNAEQALTIIKTLCKDKVIDLIVVDSVNALSPKAEQESKAGKERNLDEKTIAELARLLSEFCRKVNPDIYRAKAGMLWIGQARVGGIGTFFTRAVLSCGKALKFYAYQILFTRKGATADAPSNNVKRYFLDPDGKLRYKTEKKVVGFDSVLKMEKSHSCKSAKENEDIHLPFIGNEGYVNNFQPEMVEIEIKGTEEQKKQIRNELIEKGILEKKPSVASDPDYITLGENKKEKEKLKKKEPQKKKRGRGRPKKEKK